MPLPEITPTPPRQDDNAAAEGKDRQTTETGQPVEDSLAILWDVVSALHDGGWHEDDLPKAIPDCGRHLCWAQAVQPEQPTAA